MATDVAALITSMYPTPKKRLAFATPPVDAFGAALVEELRTRGYAVAEHAEATGYLHIKYVVDAIAANLLRVELSVGDRVLTRAYTMRDDGTYPASTWMERMAEGTL